MLLKLTKKYDKGPILINTDTIRLVVGLDTSGSRVWCTTGQDHLDVEENIEVIQRATTANKQEQRPATV